MDTPNTPATVQVNPHLVIEGLREQVSELSLALAVQTARARQAEAALAEVKTE